MKSQRKHRNKHAHQPPKLYRQGDVLIRRIEQIPDGAQPQPTTARLTIALGEVTGHAHVLVIERAHEPIASYRDQTDQIFFDLMTEAFLRHDEHATLTIPAGKYQVVRQREYTPQEIRQVAD